MDWRARRGTEILQRIVALLFLLADLAEQAALAPRRVRLRMLAVLYRAEIRAYSSVYGVACDFGAPAMPQAVAFVPLTGGDSPSDDDGLPGGDSASDAKLLALRLRALALVWTGLLIWLEKILRRQAGYVDPLGAALLHEAGLAHRLPVQTLPRPPVDTS